jgi:hypothetical protein
MMQTILNKVFPSLIKQHIKNIHRNETDLIMAYDLYDMLLNSVWQVSYWEVFASMFIKRLAFKSLFCCVFVWFGVSVILAL